VALAAAQAGIGVAALALYEPPFFPGVDHGEHLTQLASLLSRGQREEATRYNMTHVIGLPAEAVDATAQGPLLAGDVVALLDHLDIAAAHMVGHSMGGATALELAINHPDRVRRIVAASVSVRPDGLHEDLTDPARQATSSRMPSPQEFAELRDAYLRLSPHPEHFDDFLATLSASDADTRGWSDAQLAGIRAPVLLVIGDRDFTTVAHGALMQELIPGSQLAVLPDTTHMAVTRRADLLLPMLARFLDETDRNTPREPAAARICSTWAQGGHVGAPRPVLPRERQTTRSAPSCTPPTRAAVTHP